nr:PREDICTED: uncharacterized protein LOC105663206 isoform X2 [Megachile rotundata]
MGPDNKASETKEATDVVVSETKPPKKSAPTGKGARQRRTDSYRLKKNEETDREITAGIFARLKLTDTTAVTAVQIQRERHPTVVPISLKGQQELIARTWDTMEAIGTRPFQTLNSMENRRIFQKGMLIISEAKVAFAQRAHIDKPDEDLPSRKYYNAEELRDINNMVSSLPLPLAMYLECIGNVKQGANIVTPVLCEHRNPMLSGVLSYAPRQLLPLLRILRAGIPQAGEVHELAQELK